MADKLDWLNQHPIWLQYPTVAQVVTERQLKLSTELEQRAQRFPVAEDFLKSLWAEERYKDACTFCAYATSNRVAIWWGYQCVLDLRAELFSFPENKVDIADIAKPRPFNIPDWCQKLPETANPEAAAYIQQLKQQQQELNQSIDKLKQMMPPEVVDLYDSMVGMVMKQLKATTGFDFDELVAKLGDQLNKAATLPFVDEENSPIFKEADQLKAKLEKMRQETVEHIKSVIPDNDPIKAAQNATTCLDAVWAYLVTPNEQNAQRLVQVGNTCPDQVEGLLALCAFWSYGNLTPDSNQLINTPPNLMPNGLNGLIIKCATVPGGCYKPKERFERYFKLAFDSLINKTTWAPYVEKNRVPHQEQQQQLAASLNRRLTPTAAPAGAPAGAPAAAAAQAPVPTAAAGSAVGFAAAAPVTPGPATLAPTDTAAVPAIASASAAVAAVPEWIQRTPGTPNRYHAPEHIINDNAPGTPVPGAIATGTGTTATGTNAHDLQGIGADNGAQAAVSQQATPVTSAGASDHTAAPGAFNPDTTSIQELTRRMEQQRQQILARMNQRFRG